MHDLFTRDFYCQLKANDMDLSIALTKLESLIFNDTLNTATPDFSLEDLMNEQTSYLGITQLFGMDSGNRATFYL
jgi:hypothetical protein